MIYRGFPFILNYLLVSLAGITRTPGILAGLNERSQSAYAAPAPKPVDRAIGHVRPEIESREFEDVRIWKGLTRE